MRRRKNPTEVPEPSPDGRKLYYTMDVNDPLTMQRVSELWAQNVRARDVRTQGDRNEHGWYRLIDILKNVRAGNFLREVPGSVHFENLRRSIAEDGLREAIMVEVDKEGNRVLGEGHHRLAALMEIYRDKTVLVPVRFWFREGNYSPRNRGSQPTWASFRHPELWEQETTEAFVKRHKKEVAEQRKVEARERMQKKFKRTEDSETTEGITLESLLENTKKEAEQRRIDELMKLLGMK